MSPEAASLGAKPPNFTFYFFNSAHLLSESGVNA
jgi:hypothetical protein